MARWHVCESRVQPLDTPQVQGLQQQSGSGSAAFKNVGMRQAFLHVIRSEGVRALWKGNGVTIIHRLPYSAINFWAYERFTELWNLTYPSTSGSSDVLRRLVAGGAAGMCACTVVRHGLAMRAPHRGHDPPDPV
jgi:solute carrier family 25 (mitochondrial phosphate transporter), member 23/24/25/41